jgi:uncharacterized protein
MRVMIVGASTNRTKFGNQALRAYRRRGHEVLPVHPHDREIEGLRAWSSVTEVPGPIDRIALYIRPEVVETILGQLAQVGTRDEQCELWFNPGTATPDLLSEARRLGLNVVYGCAILDIGERPE